MRARFLLDENLSHAIIDAVHQFDSAIDILAVDLPGAPPSVQAIPTFCSTASASNGY
jgi:hypothetical protein